MLILFEPLTLFLALTKYRLNFSLYRTQNVPILLDLNCLFASSFVIVPRKNVSSLSIGVKAE